MAHVRPSYAAVVSEITAYLYESDPMKLKTPNEDEYEAEALSIVARFIENGVHLAKTDEEADTARVLAEHIVKHTFEFWFDLDEEHSAMIDFTMPSLVMFEILMLKFNRKVGV